VGPADRGQQVTAAVEEALLPHAKENVLPGLARADLLAAFALSEPAVSSDAASVETLAECDGDVPLQ
jgi:alkylation response protein AidB-like acyl-CoA dehydrogenase